MAARQRERDVHAYTTSIHPIKQIGRQMIRRQTGARIRIAVFRGQRRERERGSSVSRRACRSIRLALSGNGIRGAHISKGTQPRAGGKGGFGQVFLSAGNPKRVNQRDAFRGRESGIAHETRHTGKKEQADRAPKHNGRRPGYSSNGVKPHPLGPTRSTDRIPFT